MQNASGIISKSRSASRTLENCYNVELPTFAWHSCLESEVRVYEESPCICDMQLSLRTMEYPTSLQFNPSTDCREIQQHVRPEGKPAGLGIEL